MIEFLRQLDGFKFSAVIGRKIPEIFTNKHNGNATEFYFDLIYKLLELEDIESNCKYHLYLSQRQSNTEQRFAKSFEKEILDVYENDGKGRLYTAADNFDLKKASAFRIK